MTFLGRNKQKNILIFFVGFTIAVFFYFAYAYFSLEKGVLTTFITTNQKDLKKMDELQFDVIFGAPHYNGFEVYRYQDGKFQESSNRYDSSPLGEESMKYLDWLIAKDDSIKTYREMREKYGQVNLIKESGGLVYVLFDGYLIDKGSDSHKVNHLVTIDPKAEKYRVEEIEVLPLEFFNEMEPVNEKFYFVTRKEHYIEEKILFESVLYELENNKLSRYTLYQSENLDLPETSYIKNGILYFAYADRNKQETVRAVRLEDRAVIAEIPMPAGSRIEYLYYSGDRLKIYSNMAGEAIVVTETLADLEWKDRYTLEMDGFRNISKVLEYQNETYVVLSAEESNAAMLYKQKDKKLEKLVAFARRSDDLFYYNIFFFGGKQGNYLGR